MKTQKNKSKISAITLVLLLTISAILVALPSVSAHDPPWDIPSWTFASCVPNPTAVGQQVVIVFWSNYIPPTATGAYGDRWYFTIEVTKPDGSKENLGPIMSDPVGGAYTIYNPDQVGTYTIVATMLEHIISYDPYPPFPGPPFRQPEYENDTFFSSSSDPITLTVQQDPIEAWPEVPIPTEYWTRPINSANREWYQLAGNWLAGAAQNVGPTSNFGYGLAPESAHIMWATPMWAGGIMDERFGNTGYQTSHYEGIGFSPPIIINGKIFYNVQSQPRRGWRVLDLNTGEQLWFHNTTGPVTGIGSGFASSGAIVGERLAFGQIYNYESPNQHGGMPYLWSTNGPEPNTWMLFDAETGSYMCSIANVSSSGTAVYGKDGSILRYRINNGRLTCWNTSTAILQAMYDPDIIGTRTNAYWMWRPIQNYTFDGNNGFSLNVSIPDVSGSIRAVREGEFIIGGTSGNNQEGEPLELGNIWALSLEPGHEGELLWNITYTPPYNAMPDTGYVSRYAGVGGPTVVPEDGVFLFDEKLKRQRFGYDLATGELLWGPTGSEAQMNYYGMSDFIYQSKIFSYGYSGELIAYDIKTGEIEWAYNATNVGFESPYGNFPLSLACIADGKIYMYSSEHSPTQPLWRGSYLRCIDAETGDELWKVLHWGSVRLADGYLVGLNYYDNQIYCYGKGPSATTVEAPLSAVPLGSSVMIRGTVTDISSGTKQHELASRFPNGVPAIADDDMQAWMEYIYAKQAMPLGAKGVTMNLWAIDSNGNFQDIGQVTSDLSGAFGKSWVPPVPGEYYITASFDGSESYYSSSDTTYFVVDEAPSPGAPIEPEPTTPTPTEPTPTTPEPTTPEPTEPEPTTPEPTTPEPTEPAEAPLITTEVAIIAAVAVACVIGIVSFWALRKRK